MSTSNSDEKLFNLIKNIILNGDHDILDDIVIKKGIPKDLSFTPVLQEIGWNENALKALKILIKHGYDINEFKMLDNNYISESAITSAILCDVPVETIQLLISMKASFETPYDGEEDKSTGEDEEYPLPVLCAAFKVGRMDIAKLLLEHNCSLEGHQKYSTDLEDIKCMVRFCSEYAVPCLSYLNESLELDDIIRWIAEGQERDLKRKKRKTD